MVTQLPSLPKPEIIYPDSDGEPMSDNTQQFELIVWIKENLELLFANNNSVFVAGDLLWYPDEARVQEAEARVQEAEVMLAEEKQRSQLLAAKLREMGIEPNQL